jgi:hypothetical protein
MIAFLARPQTARIRGRPISINGGISAAWLPDSIFKQPGFTSSRHTQRKRSIQYAAEYRFHH